MIYAWGVSDSSGLVYHGDNHNHIFIDFSKSDGIPETAYGKEESGELSRELIFRSFYGTLSTFQSEAAGGAGVQDYPFGSVADTADEEPSTGRPLLLLSNLERNVINMKSNPKVSLEFTSLPETIREFEHPDYYDIMTKPRTTLLGTLTPVPADELEAARATYLKKHPKSAAWISFSDFTLYRMNIEDVYCVGGFGNSHYIGWIAPEQYLSIEI
ncbi:CREG1 [Symbiodinium microadriaticum]|nr:CREG1 [Symbiodinium microadriaticum]